MPMDKNTKTLLSVFLVVALMIGLSFASVPLYDLFCRVTGFGGTTQRAESLPGTVVDREIVIHFDANTSRNMPWTFEPEAKAQTVKLGQQGLISYVAENRAKEGTTGTAIYNVTPVKVGRYFHKIQCFCFAEQHLNPGQSMHMPVMYFVDPKLNEDRSMDDVTTITLSYTFFPAASEELDRALEDFYNSETN
jgi:cytochrome c oxidase assembly protein subunit 11